MNELDTNQFLNTLAGDLSAGNRVAVIKSCMDYHREQRLNSTRSRLFASPQEAWTYFLDDLANAWLATNQAETQSIIDRLVSIPGSVVQVDDLELLATLVARLEDGGFSAVPLILIRLLNEIEKPRVLIDAILKAKCRSSVLVDACFEIGLVTIKAEDIVSNIHALSFLSRLSKGLATKNPKIVTDRLLRIFAAIDNLRENFKIGGGVMEMLTSFVVLVAESEEEDQQTLLMHHDVFNVVKRLMKKNKELGKGGNVGLTMFIRYQFAVCHAICAVIQSLSENNDVPSSIVERIAAPVGELANHLYSVQTLLVLSFFTGYVMRLGDNESALLLVKDLVTKARSWEQEIMWLEFQAIVPTALALSNSNQEKKAKQLIEKYYPEMLKRWWRMQFELRFKQGEVVQALIYAIEVNAKLHNNIEVNRLLKYALSKSKKINGEYVHLDSIARVLLAVGYSTNLSAVYDQILRAAKKTKTFKAWAIGAVFCSLATPLDPTLLTELGEKVASQELDSTKKDVVNALVDILNKIPQTRDVQNNIFESLMTVLEGMPPSSAEKRKALLTILSFLCAADRKDDFKKFKGMLLRKQSSDNRFGFPLTMSLIAKAIFHEVGPEKAKSTWDQVWAFADSEENENEIKTTICEDMADIWPTEALGLAKKITDLSYQARALSLIGHEFIKRNDMSGIKDVLDGISKCVDEIRTRDRKIAIDICNLLFSVPNAVSVDVLLSKLFKYLVDKPLQLGFVLECAKSNIKNPSQLSHIQNVLASITPAGDQWGRAQFRCLVAQFLMETGNKEQAIAFIMPASSDLEKDSDLDFLTPHVKLIARLEIAIQLIRLGEDKRETVEEILSKINDLDDGYSLPWKAALSSRVGYLLRSINAPAEGDAWFCKAIELVKNPAWRSDKRYEQISKVCTELTAAGRVDWSIDLLHSVQNVTEKELLLGALCEAISIEDSKSLETILELAATNTLRIAIMKMLLGSNPTFQREDKLHKIILKYVDHSSTLDVALRAWIFSKDKLDEEIIDLVCIETEENM